MKHRYYWGIDLPTPVHYYIPPDRWWIRFRIWLAFKLLPTHPDASWRTVSIQLGVAEATTTSTSVMDLLTASTLVVDSDGLVVVSGIQRLGRETAPQHKAPLEEVN